MSALNPNPILVHAPLPAPPDHAECIAVPVDRRTLAKRLWRATAEDGTGFGVTVEQPLADGDCLHLAGGRAYVIRQQPEPVIAVPLPPDPAQAALVGWSIGNLHFPVATAGGRLLAPDDPAVRAALDRIGVSYTTGASVFAPHRAAAAAAPHAHGAGQGPRFRFVGRAAAAP